MNTESVAPAVSLLAIYREFISVIGPVGRDEYSPHGSRIAGEAWALVEAHDRRVNADGCLAGSDWYGCRSGDRCDVCAAARMRLCEAMTRAEGRARDVRRAFRDALDAAAEGAQPDGSFIARSWDHTGISTRLHLPRREGVVAWLRSPRSRSDGAERLVVWTEAAAHAETMALRARRREAAEHYEARRQEAIAEVRAGTHYETCEGQNGGRFRLARWTTEENPAWIGAPGVARGAGIDIDALHLGASNAQFERLAIGGEAVEAGDTTVHVGGEWISPPRYVGDIHDRASEDAAWRESMTRGVVVWVHRCTREGASLGWRTYADHAGWEASRRASA
jgi:hypothetical protein